jgi:hypothetical protein
MCIPLYTYICICQPFSLDSSELKVVLILPLTFPLCFQGHRHRHHLAFNRIFLNLITFKILLIILRDGPEAKSLLSMISFLLIMCAFIVPQLLKIAIDTRLSTR